MVQFKYILDKSSKKFICPSCNKRSFVKYIDSENSNYLNEQYGRCDRETNCRYHKLPTSNQTIATVNVATVNDNISYIGRYVMLQSLKKYSCNNFIAFLKVNFSDLEIQNCISKYKLGTSKHWDGATIFWQIDKFLKVRTGKIMLFNNKSGKRIKEPFAHIYWVHKKLNLQSYNLNQCLFGLHLVLENHQQNPQQHKLQRSVAIVESEKTAIIMSLFLPQHCWLATGSKQNFKLQLLAPIKNEIITVFPDKGEFSDWNTKTLELQHKGFNIKCSNLLEKSTLEAGSDLADMYFKLKQNDMLQLTEIQIEVKRLAKINPVIVELIKAFELTDKNGENLIIN